MEKDKARLVLILASSAAGGSNLPGGVILTPPHAYQSSQWLKLKTDLSICSSHTNKKKGWLLVVFYV